MKAVFVLFQVLTKFRATKAPKQFVIQSVSEESRGHKLDATEILPPCGRLNDTKGGFSLKIATNIAPKLTQNPFSWKRVQIYHPKPQWTTILTDRHPSPKTSRRFLKTPRRFDRNVGAFSEKTIKFK